MLYFTAYELRAQGILTLNGDLLDVFEYIGFPIPIPGSSCSVA